MSILASLHALPHELQRGLGIAWAPSFEKAHEELTRGLPFALGSGAEITHQALSLTSADGACLLGVSNETGWWGGAGHPLYSMAAWSSFVIATPGTLGVRRCMTGSGTGNNGLAFGCGYTTSSAIFAYVTSTTYIPETAPGTFVSGERASFGVTWRAGGGVDSEFFKNGRSVGTATSSGGASSTPSVTSNYYLAVGNTGTTGNERQWDGSIECVLHFGRQLKAADFQALHALLFQRQLRLRPRRRRLFAIPDAGGGGTAYDVSISEAVTATDSVSASLTTSPAVAEAVAALDAVSAALMGVAALAETAVAGDSVSSAATRPAAVAESAAAADSVSAGTAGYSVGISEAINATDAVSGVLAAVGALAEAVAATDVVSSLAALAAQLAEAVTVQDTVSATGASYSVSVAEAIAATDAVSARLTAIAAVIEAANATDAYASLATLTAAVTEAVAALDQVSARGVLGVTVTEAVAVTDVVSAAGALGDAPPARTIRVEMSDRVITVQSDGRTIRVSSAPRTIH